MPCSARRIAPALLCLTILAGCATTTATGATEAPDPRALACAAFAPIGWSKRDTDETILAVKRHNAAWTALACKDKTE